MAKKDAEKEERLLRMEELKEKKGTQIKNKVQSRLNHETAAMKDKKRDKFDPTKDSGRDAMTMGGKLLCGAMRQGASWRAGI